MTLPSISISPLDVDATLFGGVGVNLQGGVTANVSVLALPKIDVGLDPIHIDPLHVAIDSLPKINVGLDPIRIILDPLRCHFPVDMSVGFTLFGHDVACIRICGEAQVITEPYVPNPCECAPMKGT